MAFSFRAAVSVGKRASIYSHSIPVNCFKIKSIEIPSNSFCRSIPSFNYQNGFMYSIGAANGGVSATTLDAVGPKKEGDDKSSQKWKIKMLYDGECPLCMREVNMLRERNKSYGTIYFMDISSEDYSPEENQGLDYETVMGRIHAILSDGTVVMDIEAFRKLYEAVGLGWVYAITKYEPIATIADAIYGVWAKYRLQITGRPALEDVLEARKNKKKICKDAKACRT